MDYSDYGNLIIRINYFTQNEANLDQMENIGKALGLQIRLKILQFLGTDTYSVAEIAEALNLPLSTANLHIKVLEKSGLVRTYLQPATRGLQKMCTRVFDQVILLLPANKADKGETIEVSMPLGAYMDFKVSDTCGLGNEHGQIGPINNPIAFLEPEHIAAQSLWFRKGYVEYWFPNRLKTNASLECLELSFEASSECPPYNLNWPSDISVWVNTIEIGTWRSPADFGGVRGALTPEWRNTDGSQYGLLTTWKVTSTGCFVEGVKASNVTLADLGIIAENPIKVRIGVKQDAQYVGGINLFGRKFGNHPQDIVLKMNTKIIQSRKNS